MLDGVARTNIRRWWRHYEKNFCEEI